MKQLKRGEKAPEFTSFDYRGEKIKLSNYQGKKVLLSFHAFGSCPFCNLRVRELAIKSKEWDSRNYEMIHVFPSAKEVIGKFSGRGNPDFSILSDPKKILFKQYGVNKSVIGMFRGFLKIQKLLKAFKVVNLFRSLSNNDAAMHQLPADFLIDENGIIKEAYYAKSTSDNLSIEIIDKYFKLSIKIGA